MVSSALELLDSLRIRQTKAFNYALQCFLRRWRQFRHLLYFRCLRHHAKPLHLHLDPMPYETILTTYLSKRQSASCVASITWRDRCERTETLHNKGRPGRAFGRAFRYIRDAFGSSL